jgi:hypothetical protein
LTIKRFLDIIRSMTAATETLVPTAPTPNTEFTIKDMVRAKEAGANGDPAWLEEYFSDILANPTPARIPQSKLALLTVYKHGLEFLYEKRVQMGQIDPSDADMASPAAPITATITIAGLISGLHLNENPAIDEEQLKRPGALEWALGYRLGCALSKGPRPAPEIDKKLKAFIHFASPQIAI